MYSNHFLLKKSLCLSSVFSSKVRIPPASPSHIFGCMSLLFWKRETKIYCCRCSKDVHRTKWQAPTIARLNYCLYASKIARIRCHTILLVLFHIIKKYIGLYIFLKTLLFQCWFHLFLDLFMCLLTTCVLAPSHQKVYLINELWVSCCFTLPSKPINPLHLESASVLSKSHTSNSLLVCLSWVIAGWGGE